MYFLLIVSYAICMFIYCLNIKIEYLYVAIPLLFIVPTIFYDPIAAYIYNGYYVDTVRMFAEMDAMYLSGWEVWTPYDNLILSKTYLYLFSLTGVNNLLPIVTCFIVYFLQSYTIFNLGKYFKATNKQILYANLIVILMTSYFNVVTNIRYPLAIALLGYLLMMDLIKQKHRILCFIGYIVIANLHQGVLLVILLRYLSVFKLKYNIIILVLLCIILNTNFDFLLGMILQNDSGLLLSIAEKQNAYLESDNGGRSFTFLFRLSCALIDISSITFSIYLKNRLKKYSSTFDLITLLGLIGLYSSFSYTLIGNVLIQRVESILIIFIAVLSLMEASFKEYNYHILSSWKLFALKASAAFTICYVFFYQLLTLYRSV